MTQSKRPSIHDELIIEKVSQAIAPRIRKWLDAEESVDEDKQTVEHIAAEIAEAIRFNDDGYEIASELERSHGYSPDSELVRILDGVSLTKLRSLREACEAWVVSTGAVGPALESRCVWNRHPEYGEGVITRNHPDGRSTVFYESLGHVREGVGSHGFLVEWEDLSSPV